MGTRNSTVVGADCVSPSSRDIKSLVATASRYHSTAHIIIPKSWKNELVVAVLDTKRDGMKISHIATCFGNSCHLLLPRDWLGRRIFCEWVKRT